MNERRRCARCSRLVTRAAPAAAPWRASLGALTVVFGVGLMATAGYLISRAAERPAILSLMVTIVAVQFFGVGRPVAALPRAARLARPRAPRARPAARPLLRADRAAGAGASSTATARATCCRGWSRTSTRSRTCTCAASSRRSSRSSPARVSVGVAAAFLPAAGLVLAAGLLVGGAGRAGAGRVASAPGPAGVRRPPAAQLVGRARRAARGAPELVAFGAEQAALDRVRAADGALVRLARRDALVAGVADGLGLVVTGVTVAGVLAVAVVRVRLGARSTAC